MNGFDVNRILDAAMLRREQFPEAQCGLGHPVRPVEMEVPSELLHPHDLRRWC